LPTITQNVADIAGFPDNSAWVFFTEQIRESSDGTAIITTDRIRVAPVDGVLTVDLEPGPAVAVSKALQYHFVVPDVDSDLWSLIESYVEPDTPPTLLSDAVAAYFSAHPVATDWATLSGKPAVIGAGADAAAARDAIDAVSDLDVRLDDNRAPIDGSVGRTKLDATLSTVLGGTYFTTSTTGVLNADNNTNSTAKATMFGVTHYTNSEEPFYGVRESSDSTTNKLLLGGGNAASNAATDIEIYTAANNTTTTGTLRTNINSSGLLTHRGDITAGSNTGTAVTFSLNSAVANFRGINFYTAGSWRWAVRVDNAAEAGSDAGSNFQIVSRTDAGAAKTTLIDIARGTNLITLGGLLSTLAPTTGTAGLRLPHGTAPTSPTNGDVWTTTAGLFVRVNGSTVTLSSGSGDVVGQATSVDSEVVLFSGTGGKTIKRASTTGIPKLTSGVLSAATAGTDFVAPGGALGTPSSGTLTNCTFPTLNQSTTGSAATLTTSRNIDGQAFNGSASITVIAPGTHAAAAKTTPVDADELPLVDSAASNVLKKLTWADLKAAVASYIVNGAPGALDTLDELAAALGDDANFATTVTNALALKAPLASPTFTGTVSGVDRAMVGLSNVDNTSNVTERAATAALTNKDLTSGTNTFPTFNQNTSGNAATATTATTAGSAAVLTTPRTINGVSFDGSANISTRTVQSVTTSTTLGAAGDYVVFIGASGAPTLPTAVSNTSMYWIKNVDTADKTIATTSSQTIDGTTTIVLSTTQSITVVSDGSNWRIV
jgi:hypothetical protein